MHPMIEGAIFSRRRLQEKLFSKFPSKCHFFLDLWHSRHEPRIIYSMHHSSLFHINMGALTSHSTSKTLQQIRLSYSWVSGLNLSFSAFLLLFVYSPLWVLFSWFLLILVIVYMYTSFSSLCFSFRWYLTVVMCMKLFWTNVRQTDELLHPHACWSICWIFDSCFSCIVNRFCFHLVSLCIQFLICFQLHIGESGQPWPGLFLH